MRRNKGFTLIEVLLAASIALVILTAVYSAFYAGILNYKRVNAYSVRFQTARAVLNKIDSDLKNSFAYYNTDSGFKGEPKSIEFFTKVKVFKAESIAESEVAKVKYSIIKTGLIRQAALGADILKSQLPDSMKAAVNDVKDIKFEYALSVNDAIKSHEWVDSWPKDDIGKTRLPLAVKVQVRVGEEMQKFQRVIQLPLEVIND